MPFDGMMDDNEPMRYEVRNPEIEQKLKEMGHVIGKQLEGTGYGFSLMIFSFGDGGDMFYISNSRREDMCNSMREFIKKFEPN